MATTKRTWGSYYAAYYARNKERILAYQRAYSKKHYAAGSEYYARNKERMRAQQRASQNRIRRTPAGREAVNAANRRRCREKAIANLPPAIHEMRLVLLDFRAARNKEGAVRNRKAVA